MNASFPLPIHVDCFVGDEPYALRCGNVTFFQEHVDRPLSGSFNRDLGITVGLVLGAGLMSGITMCDRAMRARARSPVGRSDSPCRVCVACASVCVSRVHRIANPGRC